MSANWPLAYRANADKNLEREAEGQQGRQRQKQRNQEGHGVSLPIITAHRECTDDGISSRMGTSSNLRQFKGKFSVANSHK